MRRVQKLIHTLRNHSFPGFMDSALGKQTQQRLWVETRDMLLKVSPETRQIYDKLDARGSLTE